MGKFLNTCILCLCMGTGVAGQTPFGREPELLAFTQKIMGEKYNAESPMLLFLIQNSYCRKLCDAQLIHTLSFFIKKNPDLHFDLVHTLAADTGFGPAGQLSKFGNLTVYCDSTQRFRPMGLDMPEHKLFLLKNDKIIWWASINGPNRKAILKRIKTYKKAGMFQ